MKEYRCLQCRKTNLPRRDFLRVGSLSFLGLGTSQYRQHQGLQAAIGPSNMVGKALSCILIFLEGVAPQMDTWDPKGNTGFKAIGTNVAGIQISELFPRVAGHMDKISIIRSMHT